MVRTLANKRWYRLIPLVFITYSLAYVARANFGFAAAGGMAEDLQITPGMLSLMGALFFLGYFFFQIPGTIYAANRSTKKLIFWSCILWGTLASATGLISNVNILYGVRFMLGVVESAVWPALIILLSRWFTRSERSKANTFLTLGNPATIIWMSVLSGYLIESFGWRGMFIVEGVPAILWAFCWWYLVDDKPKDADWLTEIEKREFEEELKQEQQQIKPVKNYAEAFKSKAVILLCFQYGFWSIGAYGFIMWLPSIINAAPDTGIVMTGWLSTIPYLFAIIGMFLASYFSDKSLNRKAFIWPFLLIGSVAFYGSFWVGPDNFWVSFLLLVIAGAVIYIPYAPFFTALTEIFPDNVAAGAIALINSFGALGSFVGAYIVGYLNGVTGGFGASYLFMAGSLFLSAILTIIAIKGPKTPISKKDHQKNSKLINVK
ncbi:MFS transporter [Pleomorphovibrio marinus]|uniref:MFS transporter n=1 Tax=Pleomorphovibrio marinus TaxID=2164132 RepID=UPI000E0B9DCB|nr:MFS transporter [Pleomorphovibrio marinus]